MRRKEMRDGRKEEILGDRIEAWEQELATHLQSPRVYYSSDEIRRFIARTNHTILPYKEAVKLGAYVDLLPGHWTMTRNNINGKRHYKLQTKIAMKEQPNKLTHADLNKKQLIDLYLNVVNEYLAEGDLPPKAAVFIKALDSINNLMRLSDSTGSVLDTVVDKLSLQLGDKSEVL